MVNKVILLGNVGKEPEIKQFDNGSVANFSLATNETYKDKSGEKVQKTEWHNIRVGMPSLVDIVQKYVKKGDVLYCEGKIRTREYDKDGQKRYITEINVDTIRLMPKAQNQSNGYSSDAPPAQKLMNAATADDFVSDTSSMDDDLPF